MRQEHQGTSFCLLGKNDYEKVGELLKGMADKLQTSDAIWDYILFNKMQNKFKEEELYPYKLFQLIEQGNYQKKKYFCYHYI